MSSGRALKRSASWRGPCSSTTTDAPPSASSAAVTAPPAPAPITHTSASMTRASRRRLMAAPAANGVLSYGRSATPGQDSSTRRRTRPRSQPPFLTPQSAAAGGDRVGVPAEREGVGGILVVAHREQAVRELVDHGRPAEHAPPARAALKRDQQPQARALRLRRRVDEAVEPLAAEV